MINALQPNISFVKVVGRFNVCDLCGSNTHFLFQIRKIHLYECHYYCNESIKKDFWRNICRGSSYIKSPPNDP